MQVQLSSENVKLFNKLADKRPIYGAISITKLANCLLSVIAKEELSRKEISIRVELEISKSKTKKSQ